LRAPPDGTRRRRTPKSIGLTLGISKSTVHRIIKRDLHLKPFKQVKVHKLTEENKILRMHRSRALLERMTVDMIRSTVFSDETIFSFDGYSNKQNQRIYAACRNDITPNYLLHQSPTFSSNIMVFCALSYAGKLPLTFIDPHQKINAQFYQQNLLTPTINAANNMFRNIRWTWQQDSAPAHTALTTQNFLRRNTPQFISKEEWTSNSPDLAVMDFGIFVSLKKSVYGHQIRNMQDLRRWIQYEWDNFPLRKIRAAILGA